MLKIQIRIEYFNWLSNFKYVRLEYLKFKLILPAFFKLHYAQISIHQTFCWIFSNFQVFPETPMINRCLPDKLETS